MASAVIHICVAKKMNEKLKMNEKELFLGAIAPDISKIIGQDKKISHFQLDSEDDEPSLDKFLNKYQNEMNNAFIMGYFIHLYTDRLWFNDFFNHFAKGPYVHLRDGTDVRLDKSELRDLLYQDYTNLNISLIEEYDLNLSLFFDELVIPDTSLDEIPLHKLPLLVDQFGIIIKNSTHDKKYIIDYNSIISFIDITANTIYNDIKELLPSTI